MTAVAVMDVIAIHEAAMTANTVEGMRRTGPKRRP